MHNYRALSHLRVRVRYQAPAGHADADYTPAWPGVRERLCIALDVAHGLCAMHNMRLAHLDVKS